MATAIDPQGVPAVVANRPTGPEAQPLGAGTVTDNVAEQLRALIVERHLAPGHWIRSDEIATRFGVSRVPVREALQRLAHSGLVELEPRRGARVASVDLTNGNELVELFTVRLQLEPWIAGQAAERRNEADLTRLQAVIDRGSDAMRCGNLSGASRAHADLQVAVTDAAHRPHAAAAFEPLRNRTTLAFAAMAPDILPDGWPCHMRVVSAIQARDANAAVEETAHHLEMLIAAVAAYDGAFGIGGSLQSLRANRRIR